MLIEINKENIIQDSDNINKIVADFIENNITSIAIKKDFIAIMATCCNTIKGILK